MENLVWCCVGERRKKMMCLLSVLAVLLLDGDSIGGYDEKHRSQRRRLIDGVGMGFQR